jgi:2'-5' RNA ligase
MLNILLERISKITMEILNSLANFQTDYDLWEYLLVAHPTKEINNKIVDEKTCFYNNYDYESAIKTKPYITIANFLVKEAMEETLNRWIQNVCLLQNSFTVSLNNYSGFPPHTIYLRIQDAQPFKKLANALRILDGFIQSNDCPPIKLVSRPHLTIARQLPQYIYEEAIKEYAQKTFHESFEVNRLFLLKRDAYMKCHLVNTFILPPPVTVVG